MRLKLPGADAKPLRPVHRPQIFHNKHWPFQHPPPYQMTAVLPLRQSPYKVNCETTRSRRPHLLPTGSFFLFVLKNAQTSYLIKQILKSCLYLPSRPPAVLKGLANTAYHGAFCLDSSAVYTLYNCSHVSLPVRWKSFFPHCKRLSCVLFYS